MRGIDLVLETHLQCWCLPRMRGIDPFIDFIFQALALPRMRDHYYKDRGPA